MFHIKIANKQIFDKKNLSKLIIFHIKVQIIYGESFGMRKIAISSCFVLISIYYTLIQGVSYYII